VATRVLVTGATGFVGRHLLDLLVRDDVEITAWRRAGAGETLPAAHAANPRVRWVDVEVADPESVRAAVRLAAPDHVYHLAGASHVGRSWDEATTTLETNVLGTHHLLEALRAAAPGARVLLPCSGLVYRASSGPLSEESPVGPASPYGVSKLAQELLGRLAWQDDGQPVLVSRSFNHVGPGQAPIFFASSFARQVALAEAGRAAPVIEVGNLDACRDLTDVRDTVRAYRSLVALGTPGRPYNVCSGRAYRVGDILDMLIGQARTPVRVRHDPARLRPHDVPLVLGDPSRLTSETGWIASIPMERTLHDVLEDWREWARAQS
jgi:GDP-4-dehydro-6-deoxy-D-mannose reductase